ncbi:MAG TPA: hypothetical protein VFD90_07020 [Gaiellales bacterium]|jgi:hypothetical protein|nr:hypothetical protein [Gaiellales bacterium]
MSARRGLRLLAEALAIPVGLVASLGLIDALRSLPGPGVALALPLRETGHADRASVVVVVLAFGLVFGLAALALEPARTHLLRTALLRTGALLACALTLQAVSLQLVLQASLGLDWRGALGSPAPFVCALGALAGIAFAVWAASSDRWRRPGPKERPVVGGSAALPAGKIVE